MPARVLVADDEPSILRLVQVTLERHGYEVVTANDGQEALDQIAAQRPDITILDVMMPHKDGFAVIEELRANESTRDLPVLLLTAKRHDADMIHGLEAGATHYVTKPFNPTELLSMVRTLLGEGG